MRRIFGSSSGFARKTDLPGPRTQREGSNADEKE
nr:MAG TPA: hypothetical protein [Caudoviricetes sp.]